MNGWNRVNQDFVRREIDAAAELGVDIVQIDDGWQTGCTGDPAIRDEQNRRCFAGNFWELNRERFPDGILPLTEYAAARGVKMGLWFAPDSRNDFELLERDKAVLCHAYREWGIRFFKLDMLSVLSVRGCERMLELLSAIYACGGDVSVELDVTNGQRLGYFCGANFGTLFMENRYTGSGNAFPHRVLRNAWMLAHHLPLSKLQFEMVNPDLNTGKYGKKDPFAPAGYEQDYLFAVTMLACPLYWMEMQYLSGQRREELMRIVPVWQECRNALGAADVTPIGEKPDGRSLTGFCAVSNGGHGDDVYLLLIRESTPRDQVCYMLPVSCRREIRRLGGSGGEAWSCEDTLLRVRFGREKSYLFLHAKRS